MKAIGIVRNVDTLGRVVIPKELRNKMGIQYDTDVEFYVRDGGELVLKVVNKE